MILDRDCLGQCTLEALVLDCFVVPNQIGWRSNVATPSALWVMTRHSGRLEMGEVCAQWPVMHLFILHVHDQRRLLTDLALVENVCNLQLRRPECPVRLAWVVGPALDLNSITRFIDFLLDELAIELNIILANHT